MNLIVALISILLMLVTIVVLFFIPSEEKSILTLPYFKALLSFIGFIVFVFISKALSKLINLGDIKDE